MSFGIDVYNLTKNDNLQITDTTFIKSPNQGGYVLQQYKIECIDKNGNRKIEKAIKSSKTETPTPNTGTTNLSPIGDNLMYI